MDKNLSKFSTAELEKEIERRQKVQPITSEQKVKIVELARAKGIFGRLEHYYREEPVKRRFKDEQYGVEMDVFFDIYAGSAEAYELKIHTKNPYIKAFYKILVDALDGEQDRFIFDSTDKNLSSFIKFTNKTEIELDKQGQAFIDDMDAIIKEVGCTRDEAYNTVFSSTPDWSRER